VGFNLFHRTPLGTSRCFNLPGSFSGRSWLGPPSSAGCPVPLKAGTAEGGASYHSAKEALALSAGTEKARVGRDTPYLMVAKKKGELVSTADRHDPGQFHGERGGAHKFASRHGKHYPGRSMQKAIGLLDFKLPVASVPGRFGVWGGKRRERCCVNTLHESHSDGVRPLLRRRRETAVGLALTALVVRPSGRHRWFSSSREKGPHSPGPPVPSLISTGGLERAFRGVRGDGFGSGPGSRP